MTATIIPIRSEEARLWDEYLEAKDRADRTRRLEDGIAAGKAWAAFHELFLNPEGERRPRSIGDVVADVLSDIEAKNHE